MNRDDLLLITLQSSVLFIGLWLIFRLVPSIPAHVKAWLWRLAFLKPLISLLPLGVIVLPILPAERGQTPASLAESGVLTGGIASFEEAVPIGNSMDPLMAAWGLGFLLVATIGVVGTLRTMRIARRATVLERHDLLDCLADLSARAGLRRKLDLYQSKEVQSAMLMGGRRCRVILPAKTVAEGEFHDIRLMLAHEVAHAARNDLAWLSLASAAQCLFFFNPIAWLAGRSARIDHESATDHLASELAGVPIQHYADMLLRAIVLPRPSISVGSLSMGASYRSIHRRLEAMKHFDSKPTLARKALIFGIVLGTLAMLPAYQLAAAWPDQYLETDLSADQDPDSKPAIFAPRADTSGAIARTGSRVAPQRESGDLAVLPVKVVTGKNGKKRYYIQTKKGLAEITLPRGQKDLIQTRTGFAIAPGHPLTIAPARIVEGRVAAGQPLSIAPARAIERRVVAGQPLEIAPARAIEKRDVAGQPIDIAPGRIVEGRPIGSRPVEQQLAPQSVSTVSQSGSSATIAPQAGATSTSNRAPRHAETGRAVTADPISTIAPSQSTSRPATVAQPLGTIRPSQSKDRVAIVDQARRTVTTTVAPRVATGPVQAAKATSNGLTYETRSYQAAAGRYSKVYAPNQTSNAKTYYQRPDSRYATPTGIYEVSPRPTFRGSGVIEVVLPNGSRKSYKLKAGSVYEFRNGVPVEVTKRPVARPSEKRVDRASRPTENRNDRPLTEKSVDPFRDLKGDGK